MQKSADAPTKQMEEKKEAHAAKEVSKETNALPFEQFALVCAAWVTPGGRADRGYLTARRISDTEVVLCTQDKNNHDIRRIVTIPQAVTARIRDYDIDEF